MKPVPNISPGAATDLLVQLIIRVLDASTVSIESEPAQVLATREYVDRKLDAHNKAAAAAFGAGTFLFLRRRGRVGARGRLPGLRGGRSRPGRAAVDFAFFWHGALPLLGRFYAVDR